MARNNNRVHGIATEERPVELENLTTEPAVETPTPPQAPVVERPAAAEPQTGRFISLPRVKRAKEEKAAAKAAKARDLIKEALPTNVSDFEPGHILVDEASGRRFSLRAAKPCTLCNHTGTYPAHWGELPPLSSLKGAQPKAEEPQDDEPQPFDDDDGDTDEEDESA